ncbi:MAG: carboxypeptidase-like regulatory domain-containing protein [Saprospiraceae bacterium]|uniref:Carboxypeptidase-like regulatory domain-containing protein n=1 Tax=Candidatus Opimibacter skivensis TaxID=2982028 RepID=A0A9D7SU87_9BACT|nr:carboxypeptidase-like regulatory domain-containing protein [Candidatus Opimibacter skivensis]
MDQEKTYKWIQDRIRDLHAGTLTAEDRQRMEELAKTDPFVQDAMEGYQANPDHDHSVLLKVIAGRIQRKNESRRPKILPLSKGWVIPAVAASLVLILATWAVMFYIEKQGDAVFVAAEPKGSTSIEHSTEVNLSEADSLTDDISSSSSFARNDNGQTSLKTDALPTSKPASAGKESVEKSKTEKDIMKTPADDSKNIEGTIADKETREGEDEITNEPVVTSPVPPMTLPAGRSAIEMSADKSLSAGATSSKINTKKDEGYYANQMNPDLMNQRVTGNVRGRKGETLFGAQISVKNTNLITSSDYYGKFEFFIPDSISTIDISLSGYKDTTMSVAKGVEDLAITMEEKDNYSITDLLTGNATKHKFIHTNDTTVPNPEPDYILFSTYVKENSHYPVQDNYTYTCSEVKVEFKISKKGRPDSIQKIISTADQKYTAEALRLLKHGPDWQCVGDVYPCVREYTIYFK